LPKVKFNSISINKKFLEEKGENLNGGLDFDFLESIPTTVENEDNKLLISLAGICATTLYSNGIEFVNENLLKFKNDTTLLDSSGGTDDYDNANDLAEMSMVTFQLKPSYIVWNCFKFDFQYLLLPKSLKALEVTVKKIMMSPNKTLKGKEFDCLVNSLIKLQKKDRFKVLNDRYPLTKEKLIDV